MPFFNNILILSLFLLNHIGAQTSCQNEEFSCISYGTAACISKDWLCDDIQDCDDNSDETQSDCTNTGGTDTATGGNDGGDSGTGAGGDDTSGTSSNNGGDDPYDYYNYNGGDSGSGTGGDDPSDTSGNNGGDDPTDDTSGTSGNNGGDDTYNYYNVNNGQNCFEDEFVCTWKQNPVCTPNDWKCDGIKDCDNNEDEENCNAFTMGDTQETGTAAKKSPEVATMIVIISIVLIAIVIAGGMCYLRRKRSTQFVAMEEDDVLRTNDQMMQTKGMDMAEIS